MIDTRAWRARRRKNDSPKKNLVYMVFFLYYLGELSLQVRKIL